MRTKGTKIHSVLADAIGINRGRTIGYIRVSSVDQNTDRQLDGVHVDLTFEEKISGKNTERPQLQAMLKTAYKGDMVVVHSMDRLARNLRDLEDIIKQIVSAGASIKFVKENLTFGKEEEMYSTLMMQIMGAVSQFERSMIKSRQLEGIAIRKAKGLYKGKGRKRTITDEQRAAVMARVDAGDKKSAIAADMGISRESIYKIMKG